MMRKMQVASGLNCRNHSNQGTMLAMSVDVRSTGSHDDQVDIDADQQKEELNRPAERVVGLDELIPTGSCGPNPRLRMKSFAIVSIGHRLSCNVIFPRIPSCVSDATERYVLSGSGSPPAWPSVLRFGKTSTMHSTPSGLIRRTMSRGRLHSLKIPMDRVNVEGLEVVWDLKNIDAPTTGGFSRYH